MESIILTKNKKPSEVRQQIKEIDYRVTIVNINETDFRIGVLLHCWADYLLVYINENQVDVKTWAEFVEIFTSGNRENGDENYLNRSTNYRHIFDSIKNDFECIKLHSTKKKIEELKNNPKEFNFGKFRIFKYTKISKNENKWLLSKANDDNNYVLSNKYPDCNLSFIDS